MAGGINVGILEALLRLRDEMSPALKTAAANLEKQAAAIKKAGMALMPLTLALAAAGGAAIKMAGDFEQTNIAFTTMLGSGEKAKTFLKDLEKFAAKTPFEFPDLVKASQRLMAMGFSAEKVIPTMTAIGDAVAGLGGGSEMIQRTTVALGQMQAKGKVSAEEMMQLAETGIPVWRMLAEEIGVSIPRAMEMASKGAISASVGINAILTGMSTQFGGLMEQQSRTFLGQLSTLKDELGFIMRDLGATLLPIAQQAMAAFQSIIPTIKSVIAAFSELSPTTQRIIVAFAVAAAAVGPLLLALGGLMTALAPVLVALKAVAAVLAVLAGPVGIVIAVVVALGAAWVALGGSIKSFLLILLAMTGPIGMVAAAFIKWRVEITNAVMGVYAAAKQWLVDNWEGSIFQAIVRMLSELVRLFVALAPLIRLAVSAVYSEVKNWLVDQIAGQFAVLKAIVLTAAAPFLGLLNAVAPAVQGIYNTVKAWLVDRFGDLMGQLKGTINGLANMFKTLRVSIDSAFGKGDAQSGAGITATAGLASAATEKLTKTTREYSEISKEAERAAKKHAKAIAELASQLSGGDMAKQLQEFAEAVAVAERNGGVLPGQWRKIAEVVNDARQAGKKIPDDLARQADAWDRINGLLGVAAAEAKKLEESMSGLIVPAGPSKEARDLKRSLFGSGLEDATAELEKMKKVVTEFGMYGQDAFGDLSKKELAELKNKLIEIRDEFPQLAHEADVFIKILEKAGAKDVTFYWDRHAKKIGQFVDNLRDAEFATSAASKAWGMFTNALSQAGVSQETLDNLGAFQNQLNGLQAFFSGDTAAMAQSVMSSIAGTINASQEETRGDRFRAGARQGGLGNAAAAVVLGELFGKSAEDAAKLAAALAAALGPLEALIGAQDRNREAVERTRDAAERYGLTIEELGPKFAAMEMEETWGQLLEDWSLLSASGADMNAVMEKMGPAFSQAVQAAIASGTAIPEALRPIIEQLIAAGVLTDAAGNKIESLNGLEFGSLTDSMEDLVEEIHDLVAALNGLPDINRSINYSVNVENAQEALDAALGGAGGGGGGGGGPVDDAIDAINNAMPGHATGTVSTMPHVAMIHGTPGNPEVVADVDKMLQNIGRGLGEWMGRSNGTNGQGDSTADVIADRFDRMLDLLPKAIRDAVQT